MLILDFPFILLFLTLASGIIWLINKLYFAKRRAKLANGQPQKLPLLIDYSISLFPVFLIVLILRSFVAQLFVVPSGSLEPSVKPGDYILVTQYPYGIHLPVWHTTLMKTGQPKIGDIVVFHWPVNPQVDYIKRVVGTPGNKISYIDKRLYINGDPAIQTFIGKTTYGDAGLIKWHVKHMEEDLQGVKHGIYICSPEAKSCPGHTNQDFYNLNIPVNEYLMMGDNRDDSDDGRFWGFVPAKDLVGKAEFIVFSWNSEGSWIPFHKIRWNRIGLKL